MNYKYFMLVAMMIFTARISFAQVQSYWIHGEVLDINGLPIDSVAVIIITELPEFPFLDYTDEDGKYSFLVPEGLDYTLLLNYSTSISKEVSMLDAIGLQRHVLDLDPLDSPFKYLAADVNDDKVLDASDVLLVRKLSFGIVDSIPQENWRFLSSTYQFENPDNPLEEVIDFIGRVDELSSDTRLNFIGIKAGNVR